MRRSSQSAAYYFLLLKKNSHRKHKTLTPLNLVPKKMCRFWNCIDNLGLHFKCSWSSSWPVTSRRSARQVIPLVHRRNIGLAHKHPGFQSIIHSAFLYTPLEWLQLVYSLLKLNSPLDIYFSFSHVNSFVRDLRWLYLTAPWTVSISISLVATLGLMMSRPGRSQGCSTNTFVIS